MASFQLKTQIFPTPVHSTSHLKMFLLHCIPETMIYIYHVHARSVCSHKVLFTMRKLHTLRWHIF